MAVSLAMTSECRSSVTECQDGLFQQPEQFPSFSSRRLLCFPPVRLSSSPPEAALLGPGLVLSSCSLAHVAFPLLCFAFASSRPEGKKVFSILTPCPWRRLLPTDKHRNVESRRRWRPHGHVSRESGLQHPTFLLLTQRLAGPETVCHQEVFRRALRTPDRCP